MSRTKRKDGRGNLYNDGQIENRFKEVSPKKSFVDRGDGWATKSRGGPGNKRGWKPPMPKWYFDNLKNKYK